MSDAPRDRPGRASACDVATEIVRTLVDAGHVAYFAGGCVRDRIMGITPKDYDVATDARPEQVRGLFRGAHSVGESFGVVLVRRHGHLVDVATFRTDGVYSDGRHPDEVVFSDAEHDASRRDFTVNGMFEDPLKGEVIDHVGGRADIDARVITAIGDPHARLKEDRLRMLRAIRFAARFEFAIDPDTADAIREGAAALSDVSRERIGQEVRWMMTDPNRAVAAWELQYLGLDAVVLGGDHRLVAPRRVGRLPGEVQYATALAAWVVDRHDGSDDDLAEVVGRWTRSLVLSNVEARALGRTIRIHAAARDGWGGLGVAAQKRMAAAEEFDQGLLVLRAGNPQAFVDIQRHVQELERTGLAPDPLVTGDDLIAGGMTPGPDFQRILEGVYDAQLEGSISTREEGMAMARAIAAAQGRRQG